MEFLAFVATVLFISLKISAWETWVDDPSGAEKFVKATKYYRDDSICNSKEFWRVQEALKFCNEVRHHMIGEMVSVVSLPPEEPCVLKNVYSTTGSKIAQVLAFVCDKVQFHGTIIEPFNIIKNSYPAVCVLTNSVNSFVGSTDLKDKAYVRACLILNDELQYSP